MGKNLIIKGANFQNNALIANIDITSIISENLVKGRNGVTSSNSNTKAGILPRIDLSSYKAQGYNKIEVTVNVDNCITTFLCGSSDQGVSGHVYLLTGSGYAAIGTYVSDIENTYGYYFGANIDLTVADLNSFSDYCQVILKP